MRLIELCIAALGFGLGFGMSKGKQSGAAGGSSEELPHFTVIFR